MLQISIEVLCDQTVQGTLFERLTLVEAKATRVRVSSAVFVDRIALMLEALLALRRSLQVVVSVWPAPPIELPLNDAC